MSQSEFPAFHLGPLWRLLHGKQPSGLDVGPLGVQHLGPGLAESPVDLLHNPSAGVEFCFGGVAWHSCAHILIGFPFRLTLSRVLPLLVATGGELHMFSNNKYATA